MASVGTGTWIVGNPMVGSAIVGKATVGSTTVGGTMAGAGVGVEVDVAVAVASGVAVAFLSRRSQAAVLRHNSTHRGTIIQRRMAYLLDPVLLIGCGKRSPG
jgi:hypothetical protein